jgi:phage terminase large subunit-like protein
LENCSVLEQLRSSPRFSEQLSTLTDAELHALVYDWSSWARPNQTPPIWDWATWLILAGRGYGKTRVGAEMCRQWIKQGFNRVNFIAPTVDDLRDVMVEGESGILAVCPNDERPVYRVSKRRLEWPNGARSLLFSAEEPNRLRGKQSEKLWCDEPACVVGESLVETENGQQRIDRVEAGDLVWTRVGLRRVTDAWMSAPEAEVLELSLLNGRRLVGTGNHPVFIEGKGFIPLSSVRSGDTIKQWDQSRASYGADVAGGSTGDISATGVASNIVKGVCTLPMRRAVFNLSVEGEEEYFANGILVHNSWRYDTDAWDQAQFGLRLGKNPQTVATTTPRPTKLIRTLVKEETTAITRGTTYENRSNLAVGFYRKIIAKYENTRLGRQELLAEILDDNPGALFHLGDIEGARVMKLPPLVRIVIAVDPATTSNEESDEWGIVAAGQDGRDPAHFYILADESAIYTPQEAAMAAVRLYFRLQADRLVAETNNGGDMIEALIRAVDANVAYKKVTASRGKVIRAEPVSALYEQGRVHHHGMFATLEDQATSWNPKTDEDSPDRMDAMVWAVTELASGTDGWAGFVKDQGKAAQTAGLVPGMSQPGERIDVAGVSHDVCVCGCTFWVTIAGKEYCIKCQTPRPA